MENMSFSCTICGEGSTEICVYCTKDTCGNHLCERCMRCSDCCDCELRVHGSGHLVEEFASRNGTSDGLFPPQAPE